MVGAILALYFRIPMSESALPLNSYSSPEEFIIHLGNFLIRLIGLSPEADLKSSTDGEITETIRQNLADKYNFEDDSQLREDFLEVLLIWVRALDFKNKKITNKSLALTGFAELQAFLEKHWSTLYIEDKNAFRIYSKNLLTLERFERELSVKSPLIVLLGLVKKYGWKIIFVFISLANNFNKVKNSSVTEEVNSFLPFWNAQIALAHEIAELVERTPIDWDNVDVLIERSRKALEHIKKRRLEINAMSEEEKEAGRQFDELLLDLIEKNKF